MKNIIIVCSALVLAFPAIIPNRLHALEYLEDVFSKPYKNDDLPDKFVKAVNLSSRIGATADSGIAMILLSDPQDINTKPAQHDKHAHGPKRIIKTRQDWKYARTFYYEKNIDKLNRALQLISEIPDKKNIDVNKSVCFHLDDNIAEAETPDTYKNRGHQKESIAYDWSITVTAISSHEGIYSMEYRIDIPLKGNIDIKKIKLPFSFKAHLEGNLIKLIRHHNEKRGVEKKTKDTFTDMKIMDRLGLSGGRFD